MLVCNRYNRL